MRFLADESCDVGVVRALRSAGFDVLAVAELSPRASDEAVADLAILEARVLKERGMEGSRFRTLRRLGWLALLVAGLAGLPLSGATAQPVIIGVPYPHGRQRPCGHHSRP